VNLNSRSQEQNITVIASFGQSRELAFLRKGLHDSTASTSVRVDVLHHNNSIISIGRDVSMKWLQGMFKIPNNVRDKGDKGTVTIVLFGKSGAVADEPSDDRSTTAETCRNDDKIRNVNESLPVGAGGVAVVDLGVETEETAHPSSSAGVSQVNLSPVKTEPQFVAGGEAAADESRFNQARVVAANASEHETVNAEPAEAARTMTSDVDAYRRDVPTVRSGRDSEPGLQLELQVGGERTSAAGASDCRSENGRGTASGRAASSNFCSPSASTPTRSEPGMITLSDVIVGRNQPVDSPEGNARLNSLLEHATTLIASGSSNVAEARESIIRRIRRSTPPGRFLHFTGGAWYEIGKDN